MYFNATSNIVLSHNQTSFSENKFDSTLSMVESSNDNPTPPYKWTADNDFCFRICYIAYAAGFWVYPVFEVLDMKGRTIFLAALLLPNLLFVHLGPKLHNKIWGK